MSNYGLKAYKQTSVTTASRGQILIMLYEGAIRFAKQATDALKVGNRSEKGKYILKVQDILNELSCTLDHNAGGDISKELERLYAYMVDQLTEANLKNEVKPLETVIKLLETLLEGWRGAVEQVAKHGGDPVKVIEADRTAQQTQATNTTATQQAALATNVNTQSKNNKPGGGKP